MTVDFTMMYAAHEAFSRDLRRMSAACAEGTALTPSVRAGWETFAHQLHIHHTAEDEALWPPLRAKVVGTNEVAVLDEMEMEHAQLEPLLEQIDKALRSGDTVTLRDTVQALDVELDAHMRHEEHEALPLVDKRLGESGWREFIGHLRRTQGLRGGAEFMPWLLDDLPTGGQVLRQLPPPVRLLYRGVWKPRYQRTARW